MTDRSIMLVEGGTEPSAREKRVGLKPEVSVRAGAVAALASATVFFAVFRPWQGGLLEEWSLARLWDQIGFASFGTTLPATAGRPLHLLPHFVGLALGDGGLAGEYLVFGCVVLVQLWGSYWALGRLVGSRWLRLALGMLIAMHPWWPAGDVLRFLPAQIAVATTVLWFGVATRYVLDGGKLRAALLYVIPLIGLLHYQATALALMLGAVAITVVIAPTWRRAVVVVLATGAAVATSFVWSVLIAPLLVTSSYESELSSAGLPDVVASARAILSTLVHDGRAVIVLGATAAIVVVSLGFAQRLSASRAWAILAVLAASPLAAFVYSASLGHLNDPERVVLPIGVACWLVLCAVSHLIEKQARLVVVLICLSMVAALVGGFRAYVQWGAMADAQQSMIASVGEVRDEVPPGSTLIAADMSGRYGDVYLLLPPYLDIAVQVQDGEGAPSILCTPDGVVRDHPFAAVYPIPTTESCTPMISAPGAAHIGTGETVHGPVEFYTVPTDELG